MKNRHFIIMIFFLLFSVVGCNTGREEHFSKIEAGAYLEDTYDEAFIFVDEEYNEDEDTIIFTFQAKDRNTQKFNVFSMRNRDGLLGCLGDGCQYELSDNYVEKSEQTILEKYQKEITDETIKVDLERLSVNVIYQSYEEIEDSILKAQPIYEELNDDLPKNAHIGVEVGYYDPAFAHIFPDFYIHNDEFDLREEVATMQTEYVQILYAYRLTDTSIPVEILEEVKKNEYTAHSRYEDTYKLYTLQASPEITYSVLFEIFTDLGYSVEGTAQDFSVIYDGDVYRFSYAFYDVDNRDAYYLKNGEQIRAYRFIVTEVAGINVSSLDKNVCIYDENNEKVSSMCFDKVDGVYVNNSYSGMETAENYIQGLDYVVNYNNNCSDHCTSEGEKNQKKYLNIEKEFGSSLAAYGVYEIEGDTYIIDETFEDKKGFYYYKNLEKEYLPEKTKYVSLENIEVLFSCDITYDEVTNTFKLY